MRARRKARVELRALAADYDAELVDLLRELGEIRDEYHTRLLTDAAVYERKQMAPGTPLQKAPTGGACACADAHSHLSGMTISRSLVSTTKMARSLAGSVLLALWLTW